MSSARPSAYSPLLDRLSTWFASAPDAMRADYVRALGPFLERTRNLRRAGSLLMLATAIAAAARLQGDQVAGPIAIVNVLTTGALAALLPVTYGLGLRQCLAAHVAHNLGAATYRILLRVTDGGATALHLHGPLLPPESLGPGDLLRWGVARDRNFWTRCTAVAEIVASLTVLALLVVGGPWLCAAAALRAPSPWGVSGAALGGLLAFTALRPFWAEAGIRKHDRPHY